MSLAPDEDDAEPPDLLDLEEAPVNKRVPITVLTGALGSGKSTLLSYILSEQHGKKIAVIVNEFGDTGDIERKSLQLSEAGALYDEVLELKNGCLCCSFKDLGVTAIEKMMERKGEFDHVVLETTGLADPVPIAQNFWQDDELSRDLYLDGVICLVDAVNVERHLQSRTDDDTPFIGERQIGCADVLLLSKTDLLEDAAAASARRSRLAAINGSAPIYSVDRGRVDLSLILDLDAYAAGSKPFRLAPDLRADLVPTVLDDVGPGSRFDQLIRTLLWDGRLDPLEGTPLADVLRSKALLHDAQGGSYVLQGVQDVFEIKSVQPALEIPAKLVLIGRHLPATLSDDFLKRLHCRPEAHES